MPIIIECIYENSIFKPLKKVGLRDGQKVKIIIFEEVSLLKRDME
ncbi:antitoxin family protein [Pyrococcus abyssi]|nr:antitoxin family protein [Pyrococcus abyssi]